MAKKRDPLGLTPHWHADLRLEAELPEDNVVGTRFLFNALFGSAALIMVLVAGWVAYIDFSIRKEIQASRRQIQSTDSLAMEVPLIQTDFLQEAKKLEHASNIVKRPFPISEFIDSVGRSKPEKMIIDAIEWNDAGVFVRGNLRGFDAFNSYIAMLKTDPKISHMFSETRTAEILPAKDDPDLLIFAVQFRLRVPPPTP